MNSGSNLIQSLLARLIKDNQCKTCSSGSLSFTVNNKCKQIAVSDSQYLPLCQVYEHSNGTCRLCQNGYKNLVDNKCYTSNLSNCQYFFPHQGTTVSPQCAVCKAGSQIYEGACYDISTTEADSENCLVHDQFGACIFCRKGFVNIYKSTQTQAVVKSHKCEDFRSWVSDPKANEILACLSFEKNASGDVTCFSCIDGFALDDSDKCVPCRPQFLTPNQQDAFIYKASSNSIYCKNDFSNANFKCLYFASSAADKCLVFAAKTAGALLVSEMDTPSNYVNVLAMHKSFYGELRGNNWRDESNATIAQLPYALVRRKDLSGFASLSKLKHYLYADQANYDSNTILGGVCHVGYCRDFTSLTSSADDCKTIVKHCDVKARVFYEGKTSHLISCNRCYNSENFKVVVYTIEQVIKTHLPNINTSLAKGYSADHLPSTFCYEPINLAEQVANCGVYEVKNKTSSYEGICRACLPKYKPTYKTTEAENIIEQCTLIPNCLTSSIGNRCQMCSSSNSFKQDLSNYQSSRQTCHTLPNKAANCLEFSGDASDPTCTLCNPGFNNPSAGCEGHWLADCSHFDAQGRCVKCEGIRKIAFYSNVIKPTETGCIPGSFKSLKFCKSQYTENLCFECESGFVLNSEGRCFSIWKVPYCQEYERISEQCVKCKDFYELDRDSQTCRPLMPSQKLVSDIDAANPIALTSFQCGPALPNGISYPHLHVVDSGTQRLCANIGIDQCELLDETKQVSNNQLQCEVCRNGFLKETLTTPLKKCLLFEPILNCQTQSVNSSFEVVCDQCLPGHYIDIQGLCSSRSASPKCIEFIPNFDKCKQCESDYYLNGNTCQSRTNISTDCQEYYQTMDQCRVFKLDVQFLETRYKAFEINPPASAPEVQARIEGRILDSGILQNLTDSNRVLEGETTNTDTTNTETTNTETTTTTQTVPEATEPSATKGIVGCQIYSSENICLECQVNNYLHQNQCLPVDINVPNCAVFSRKDKCASCETNYFLKNSLCVKALAPNCLIYETEVKCSFCDFTHPFRDSEGQCLKNPDTPNCQLYKTLSECEICDSGYYLTVNRKCIEVSSPVTHCVEYVSASECSECEIGYLIKEQTVGNRFYFYHKHHCH